MKKFGMTCSCGMEMAVDAESRDQAVSQLKAMMTADAIAGHMAEKHPGELVWSMEQVHAAIEKDVKEV